MNIKTINPITIDGKHISKPSEYLSADGEDYYGADGEDYYDADGDDEYYDADGDDDYYGFDATGKPVKGNKAEITQFQNFANSKGESLVVDGLWGAKSETAWGKWGADFAKSIGIGTPSTTPTAEPTKDEAIAKAKLGQIWDKNKGWITSDKSKDVLRVLLGGGSVMDAINSLLGGSSGSGGATGGAVTDGGATGGGTATPPPTGLSKNAKIGIAVGIAVLLIVVIVVATKPTTPTKVTK
jgi:hypothetical protein